MSAVNTSLIFLLLFYNFFGGIFCNHDKILTFETKFEIEGKDGEICAEGQTLSGDVCINCAAGSRERLGVCLSCGSRSTSDEGETSCEEKKCVKDENLSLQNVLNLNPPSFRKHLQIPEIGGGCRFKKYPLSGAVNTMAKRFGRARYQDNEDEMMIYLPSARSISNKMCSQKLSIEPDVPSEMYNERGTNLLLIYFGQFVDHDITLIKTSAERMDIEMPTDESDIIINTSMKFSRSQYVKKSRHRQRNFLNTNTAWLDLSNVYGHTLERSNLLRSFVDGKLLMSNGSSSDPLFQNLPLVHPETGQVLTECNATCQAENYFFICGDSRCTENLILTAIHTIFAREHNRLAKWYKETYLTDDDEEIFQNARFRNILQYQKVVIDFLKTILGRDGYSFLAGEYEGIQDVDPSIELHFSTVAYRFGHTAIGEFQPRAQVVDGERKILADKFISLFDSFDNSKLVFQLGNENVLEELLNGAQLVMHEKIDSKIIDTLRNKLFRDNLDLASLNIQRGRDHGVLQYNKWRKRLSEAKSGWNSHLQQMSSFEEMTGNDANLSKALNEAYQSKMYDVDPWIAGLCEKNFMDSMLGETFSHAIAEQFSRIRDSDPYWFQQDWISNLDGINLTSESFSTIIQRNVPSSFANVLDPFHTRPLFPVEIHYDKAIVEWLNYNEKYVYNDCTDATVRYDSSGSKVEIPYYERTDSYTRFAIPDLQPATKYTFEVRCGGKTRASTNVTTRSNP